MKFWYSQSDCLGAQNKILEGVEQGLEAPGLGGVQVARMTFWEGQSVEAPALCGCTGWNSRSPD